MLKCIFKQYIDNRTIKTVDYFRYSCFYNFLVLEHGLKVSNEEKESYIEIVNKFFSDEKKKDFLSKGLFYKKPRYRNIKWPKKATV